jgi:hypothetical protein
MRCPVILNTNHVESLSDSLLLIRK